MGGEVSAAEEVQRGLGNLQEGNFTGALKHSASALELSKTTEELYDASAYVYPGVHFATMGTDAPRALG